MLFAAILSPAAAAHQVVEEAISSPTHSAATLLNATSLSATSSPTHSAATLLDATSFSARSLPLLALKGAAATARSMPLLLLLRRAFQGAASSTALHTFAARCCSLVSTELLPGSYAAGHAVLPLLFADVPRRMTRRGGAVRRPGYRSKGCLRTF